MHLGAGGTVAGEDQDALRDGQLVVEPQFVLGARELIADDRAIDLDGWLDNTTFLLSCPKRLIDIGYKIREDKAAG